MVVIAVESEENKGPAFITPSPAAGSRRKRKRAVGTDFFHSSRCGRVDFGGAGEWKRSSRIWHGNRFALSLSEAQTRIKGAFSGASEPYNLVLADFSALPNQSLEDLASLLPADHPGNQPRFILLMPTSQEAAFPDAPEDPKTGTSGRQRCGHLRCAASQGRFRHALNAMLTCSRTIACRRESQSTGSEAGIHFRR
jgi:hypothetical protein